MKNLTFRSNLQLWYAKNLKYLHSTSSGKPDYQPTTITQLKPTATTTAQFPPTKRTHTQNRHQHNQSKHESTPCSNNKSQKRAVFLRITEIVLFVVGGCVWDFARIGGIFRIAWLLQLGKVVLSVWRFEGCTSWSGFGILDIKTCVLGSGCHMCAWPTIFEIVGARFVCHGGKLKKHYFSFTCVLQHIWTNPFCCKCNHWFIDNKQINNYLLWCTIWKASTFSTL